MGDARTINARSARDLLFAYLIIGVPGSWGDDMTLINVQACSRVGARQGWALGTEKASSHISGLFHLTYDDFHLVSETEFLFPPE